MKNELKKFGMVMAGAFIILGILFRFKSHLLTATILALFGFLFAFFGLFLPKALRPINFIWMKFSLALGFVMTRIILAIVFFLIVTPVAVIARIFGKHFLDLEIDKNKKSYWQKKGDVPQNLPTNFYERQF
ncbi:MAG: SxtJ family membrane protein [bacterium]